MSEHGRGIVGLVDPFQAEPPESRVSRPEASTRKRADHAIGAPSGPTAVTGTALARFTSVTWTPSNTSAPSRRLLSSSSVSKSARLT